MGTPYGQFRVSDVNHAGRFVTAPSIGRADFQQLYRNKDVGPRNREENNVLPERCGFR